MGQGENTMDTNKTKKMLLGGVIVATVTTPVFANELSASVGAAVIGSQSYIIGENHEARIVPYVELGYGMFSLNEDGLTMTYEVDDANSVSVIISQRESVFDRGDNNKLRHFDKRDSAVELTANWMYSFENGDITLSATGDVSNTHDGYEIGMGYSKNIVALGGMLIPSVAVALQSEELVDYYYGVSSKESTSDIAEYKGKDSLTAALSVAHIYSISEDWSTFTNVSWQYLGSGISDSSIVKKDNVWTVILGAAYEF